MLFAKPLYMLLVCACGAALAVSFASCDRRAVLERVEDQYARGNCRDAAFIVRHHLRKGGERTPELLVAGGRALLCLGNESEAADYFNAAVEADSAWAPSIADVLCEEALASFERGAPARGKRFILQAIGYRPDNDFGAYNSLAGELLLERREYEEAIRYFKMYLAHYPDTAGASAVTLSLGEAYEGLGATEQAIEVYTRFAERFPISRMRSTAQYRLEKLLLEEGERLAATGEQEEARRLLEQLAGTADNQVTLERTHFMLGGIAEAQADFERALKHYWEIMHLNPGSSGRLVERAKERIEQIETERLRRR